MMVEKSQSIKLVPGSKEATRIKIIYRLEQIIDVLLYINIL